MKRPENPPSLTFREQVLATTLEAVAHENVRRRRLRAGAAVATLVISCAATVHLLHRGPAGPGTMTVTEPARPGPAATMSTPRAITVATIVTTTPSDAVIIKRKRPAAIIERSDESPPLTLITRDGSDGRRGGLTTMDDHQLLAALEPQRSVLSTAPDGSKHVYLTR